MVAWNVVQAECGAKNVVICLHSLKFCGSLEHSIRLDNAVAVVICLHSLKFCGSLEHRKDATAAERVVICLHSLKFCGSLEHIFLIIFIF